MSESTEIENTAPGSEGLGALGRMVEALIVLVLFAGFLHLVMRPESGWVGTGVAGAIIALGLMATMLSVGSIPVDSRRMWSALFALAAGLWAFNAFRRMGFAFWPTQQAPTHERYFTLLYMHFVLLITMGAAAAWAVYRAPSSAHRLHWGNWRLRRTDRLGVVGLATLALVVWGWAGFMLWRDPLEPGAGVAVFLGIAVLKGSMGALIEEGCYRGVVLPMASARIGVGAAIVLQACMYAVFHAYLSPGLVDAKTFVALAFVLGLVFGLMTHITKGIGWAWLTHSAIAVVIEWQNLP